jgi:hypothetical protein
VFLTFVIFVSLLYTANVPAQILNCRTYFFCLEAVRVKYRISILHYDTCYSKLIKPRMSDFLIDERKRQAKALGQQLANNGETNHFID